MDDAKAKNLVVRVDVATAWVCPFEGPMPEERVFEIASCFLNKSNVDEVALADTLGHAHRLQVHALFSAVAENMGLSAWLCIFTTLRGWPWPTVLQHILQAFGFLMPHLVAFK